jgi:hypothetical protein
MMMQDNTVQDATNAAGGLASQLEKVSKSLKDSNGVLGTLTNNFKDNVDRVSIFETKLISSSRSLGQGAIFAKSMEGELGRAAVNVVKMGGEMNAVLETFQKVQESLGRTVFLSQQFYENAFALQRAGVDPKTINSFADFFDTVGGGFQRSTEQQIQLVNQAKSYGLNVGQFLSTVGDKLQVINRYGFPNGIKDLSEMVAKSQLLGNTLDVAQGLADQIMDSPERAYEFAAQLQTLGGSFSQLGDGAQLLYMAQNDLSGLNDQIINATRGIASFNEESGQFEISANERLRLRALNKLGLDAKAIEEAALKLAKQEQILSKINLTSAFSGLDEEQKRVLASFAEIGKGGVVTIKGEEIGGLSADKVREVLGTIQGSGSQLSKSTDENIKTQQANLSATESVTLEMNMLNQTLSLASLNTGTFSSALEQAAGIITNIQSGARGVIESGGNQAINLLSNPIANLSETVSALSTYVRGQTAQTQKVTVESAKPITIELGNSFNLGSVVQQKLGQFVSEVVRTTVEEEVNKILRESGYSK